MYGIYYVLLRVHTGALNNQVCFTLYNMIVFCNSSKLAIASMLSSRCACSKHAQLQSVHHRAADMLASYNGDYDS